MTKVYLDEINAALSSSTFSTLAQDNADSTTVNTSIQEFITGSSEKLQGAQWEAVRTKLGTYQTVLEERGKVATILSEAISKALNKIKNYMSPYAMLDTGKLGEYTTQRTNCLNTISALKSMLNETITTTTTYPDGSTSSETTPAYDNDYIRSQITLAETTLDELDKLIEKIEGLDAVYSEAEGILSEAGEAIAEFQNKVKAIKPSGKYSYQK